MKTEKTKKTKDWAVIGLNTTGIFEWPSGYKQWREKGRLHNINDAAVVWPNGEKEYWVLGQVLTREKFEIFRFLWKNTKKRKTKKLMKIFVGLAKIKW